MFSKYCVGGDDVGLFTGKFPQESLVVPGDTLVWSFLSDAGTETLHWGFRFTVTPIFSDEYLALLQLQSLEEYKDALHSDFTDWNPQLDSELVHFVNLQSERLKVFVSCTLFTFVCLFVSNCLVCHITSTLNFRKGQCSRFGVVRNCI
jgi:hypothetical protein